MKGLNLLENSSCRKRTSGTPRNRCMYVRRFSERANFCCESFSLILAIWILFARENDSRVEDLVYNPLDLISLQACVSPMSVFGEAYLPCLLVLGSWGCTQATFRARSWWSWLDDKLSSNAILLENLSTIKMKRRLGTKVGTRHLGQETTWISTRCASMCFMCLRVTTYGRRFAAHVGHKMSINYQFE